MKGYIPTPPCDHHKPPCPVRVGEINYTAEQINELLGRIPHKADRSEVPSKVTSYNDLKDKPTINYRKLEGNKSAKDLGLVSEDGMLDITDKLAIEIHKAKKTAQTAAEAVSTLKGLENADTSAIIAASVIMQVQENKSHIEEIKSSVVYLSQRQYDELITNGAYDPNTEYNVFEEDDG